MRGLIIGTINQQIVADIRGRCGCGTLLLRLMSKEDNATDENVAKTIEESENESDKPKKSVQHSA